MHAMPSPLAFISYRRSDAQQAALGLHSQLRMRLGASSVFMDRSGISAGERWPKRLRDSMADATVVLALIGPKWLKAADRYGKRRLDIPDDWVRVELETALKVRKPIVPILVGGNTKLPDQEGLPSSLSGLLSIQAHSLREDRWDSDLNDLVRLMVEVHGFRDEPKVPAPDRMVKVKPLTPAKIDAELKRLGGSRLRASYRVIIPRHARN